MWQTKHWPLGANNNFFLFSKVCLTKNYVKWPNSPSLYYLKEREVSRWIAVLLIQCYFAIIMNYTTSSLGFHLEKTVWQTFVYLDLGTNFNSKNWDLAKPFTNQWSNTREVLSRPSKKCSSYSDDWGRTLNCGCSFAYVRASSMQKLKHLSFLTDFEHIEKIANNISTRLIFVQRAF